MLLLLTAILIHQTHGWGSAEAWSTLSPIYGYTNYDACSVNGTASSVTGYYEGWYRTYDINISISNNYTFRIDTCGTTFEPLIYFFNTRYWTPSDDWNEIVGNDYRRGNMLTETTQNCSDGTWNASIFINNRYLEAGRYAIILEAHGIPSSWGGRDTSIEGNFTINIFCQNQEITPIPTSYPTPPTAPTVPLPTPYIYKRACQATTGCCSGSNCYFNDGCLSGYGGVCGGGNSSTSWGERIEIENKYENIRDYGSDIHVEIDRKGCILFNGEIMENNKLYSETYDFDDCNTYDGYCGWECAVWLCTNSQICDQDGNVIVDGGGSIGLSKACRDIHSVELMILFLAFMIIFV